MNFSPAASFFRNEHVSLKVCGVTRSGDAEFLASLGVGALGVNFWPSSKRYCAPDIASPWLKSLGGSIVRVGVFVNAEPELPRRLIEEGVIDLAQFHGDETPDYCLSFVREALPFVKAFGVVHCTSLRKVTDFHSDAVLLDAPAPGVYGGTGSVFDWNLADMFVRRHKDTPVLLAGGITVENAAQAARLVRPAFIDVASGSETEPGVKDREKCSLLHEAVREVVRSREGEVAGEGEEVIFSKGQDS